MPDTHEYLVNTKFPEFSLYDDEEKLVSRADIEGKWTVIFFYPKDDSPGCTLQSCSFRDQYEQFTKKGVLLYGVSSDSISSHRNFKKRCFHIILKTPEIIFFNKFNFIKMVT